MGLLGSLKRFWARDDRGAATVEFVIVFPALIMVFIMGFEAAMLLSRQVMLDRAIDMTVRDLRLGTGTTVTHSMIRSQICGDTVILPHCSDTLTVEMIEIPTTTYALPTSTTPCVDMPNAVQPITTFDQGSSNSLMLVRVCYVVRPFFPTSALGLELTRDTEGAIYMTAMTAFASEPLGATGSTLPSLPASVTPPADDGGST